MGDLQKAAETLDLSKGNSYELLVILSEGKAGWRKEAAEWCNKCESDLCVAKAIKAVCVFEPENAAEWLEEVTAPIRREVDDSTRMQGEGLFNGGALGVLMSALWLDNRKLIRHLKESEFSKSRLAPMLAEIAFYQASLREKHHNLGTLYESPSEECEALQSNEIRSFLFGDEWGGWKTRYRRVGVIYEAIIGKLESNPGGALAFHLNCLPIGSLIDGLSQPIIKRMTKYGRLKAVQNLTNHVGNAILFHELS